jgi:hypothetical protein
LVSCETPPPAADAPPRRAGLSPVLQRMQQTYDDLAAGRFVSLADFETPGQELLFRTIGPDGAAGQRPQPTLSILRSRNETGAGGLKARFADAGDSLRFDGQRSPDLALVRDWQPYSLLLMSIFGPPEGTRVEFSVESGTRLPQRWTRTLNVAPGWNLYRLDVATIGDQIALHDVRSLVWRVPAPAAPIELYFDDLILADNGQAVLGAQAGPGELYINTRGRRIQVGVRERFELEFADGLIVAWRSGSPDNLTDYSGLGPWPVPLAENWTTAAPVAYDDPALYATWGAAAATTQRIVEATPFRAAIEGRWAFGPPGDLDETAPGHAWRYTVYPQGQVYVRVRSTAPPGGWGAARVGYAIALDGRRDFAALPPADAQTDGFALLARPGGTRADLLWSWSAPTELRRRRVQTSADDARLAIVVGDLAAAQAVETAHLLRLWPPDIDGVPEAAGFSNDYAQPAALEVSTGSLITDAPGDLNRDGYNESEGCFELSPGGRALRFQLEPARLLRFDPVFRVHETAGQRCWVYARGRMIQTVGRDAEDNLLVWLGSVVSGRTAVEVHQTREEEPPRE